MNQAAGKPPEGRLLITVRPTAEVTIKAPRTRDTFLRKLRVAAKDALQRAGFDTRVRVRANRILAEAWRDGDLAASVADASAVLQRVFGVSSFSFLEASSAASLEEIVATGKALFAERVAGKRYAVRCKRTGRHDFSSMDVERQLGAALNPGATVDLTDPEVTVEVEVGQERAHYFSRRYKGAGGLPTGTGGHALALLSGGYDSIVAAWHLMRRGVQVDFVHFRLGDHPSENVALGVAKLMSDAWGAGSRPEAHVIDLRGAVDEMRGSVTPNLWQVSLKRLMVRAADGVADALQERAQSGPTAGSAPADHDPRQQGRRRARRQIDALVTGEAIGQVSSQTLSNLRTIDAAAQRPVLRPLIGFDKFDIMALAERIGTAALSATAIEECNITPVKPATSSNVARLEREEAGMVGGPLEAELARVRTGLTRVPLRAWQPGEGVLEAPATPAFGISQIPAGAVLLDCRPGGMRRWRPEWPLVQVAPEGGVDPGRLDKGLTYVAFCPHGLRSEAAAQRLREGGIEAYTFLGGEDALKGYLAGLAAAAEHSHRRLLDRLA